MGEEERGIRHFLAYGHADQAFFLGQRNLYDGLTIPGTVAAFYQQGAGGFVLAQRKPYFIDPRTPVFQGSYARSKIRQSHVALARIHGPTVQQQLAIGPLDPSSLTAQQRQHMVRAVLEFQRTFVHDSTQKIDKYFELIGRRLTRSTLRSAEWLIPPYFYDQHVAGPDYQVSLGLAKMAVAEMPNEPVRPVACILRSALSTAADVDQLVNDYAPFGQVMLFPSRFDETKASVIELRGFWNAVSGLSRRACRPFMLYGGYFSVLSHHAGLDGMSHGIGYGESRDALSPSSGPAGERFYIPALHRFFPIDQAQTLLQLDRNASAAFRCDCDSCSAARAANRGGLQKRTREDLFVHFLRIRQKEMEEVQRLSLADLAHGLRSMRTYAVTLAPAMADDFTYLAQWADAIDPPASL